MNLYDFEDRISSKIIGRGYDYYISEAIVSVEYDDKKNYILNVNGSREYSVEISLDDDNEILDSFCDCPYDMGPYCKHEVASFYYLRDYVIGDTLPSNDHYPIVDKNTFDFNEVLLTLPKDTLTSIIRNLTEDDPAARQKIIYKYSEHDSVTLVRSFEKMMSLIVDKHRSFNGMIPYGRSYYYVEELEVALRDGIRKSILSGDYMAALIISLKVACESINAFNYSDDSDGFIDSLIYNILDDIREICRLAVIEKYSKLDALFSTLINIMDDNVFSNQMDYVCEIIRVCIIFTRNVDLREILISKIYSLMENDDSHFSDYYNEKLLVILYGLYSNNNLIDEADKILHENLHKESFKDIHLENLIRDNKHEDIISFTLSLEKDRYSIYGNRRMNKYSTARYEAYRKLSMKKEQWDLALEIFMDGDFDYYHELRALSSFGDVEFYAILISEFEKLKDYKSNISYLKLINRENDFERILDYIKHNPYSIKEYAYKLYSIFPDEVKTIYRDYIFNSSENASKRSAYRHICDDIKDYYYITKDRMGTTYLINELSTLYTRRSAFKDELNKIKL